MAEPEKKKRGRPKLSEEDKRRRQLERLGYVPPDPPSPKNKTPEKNGGVGVDKKDKLDGIYDSLIATDPRKRHKIDINDHEEIMKAFFEYIENCKENGTIASNVGFALWIGYSEEMLNKIRARAEGAEKPQEVVDALNYIRGAIEKIWVEGGAAGVIRDAMAIFVTSNKFGYRDTKHVEHHAEIDNRLGTTDYKSLEDKYSSSELIVDVDYEVVSENSNDAESQNPPPAI